MKLTKKILTSKLSELDDKSLNDLYDLLSIKYKEYIFTTDVECNKWVCDVKRKKAYKIYCSFEEYQLILDTEAIGKRKYRSKIDKIVLSYFYDKKNYQLIDKINLLFKK